MGNIIGEPFEDYVDLQIDKRQKLHGKIERTAEEITYLNSTLAWVKLASGVSLTQERLNLLKNQYNNSIVNNTPPGKELALNNVLFNGINKAGSEDNQRTGYNNINGTYSNDPSLGGTEFGIVPMPGIVSMDSQDLNRGSIKKSRVKLKAYNRQQFDIIDVLYLRLGHTVLLEFGNSHFWDSGENIKPGSDTLTPMSPTLIDTDFFKKDDNYYELLEKIEDKRRENRGNYDGILGTISNFSWTFAADGTYDIDLDIMSIGSVIESLKINLPPLKQIGNELEYADRQAVLAQFRNKEIDNIDNFYILYPEFKTRLRDWWDKSISGNEQTTTYTLQEDTIDYTPKIKRQGVPGLGQGQYESITPTEISDVLADPEFVIPRKDTHGTLSIKGVGRSEEQELLAQENINKYKNPAIKFAIITMFQGVFGGSNRYQKDLDGNIMNPYANEGFLLNELFPNDKDQQRDYQYGIFNKTEDGKNDPRQRIYGENKNVYSQFAEKGQLRIQNLNGKKNIFEQYAFSLADPGRGFTNETLLSPFVKNYDKIRAQKVLFNNLYGGFEVFEQLVFTYFKKVNAAGGANDNQFSDDPTFSSYAVELEYEKNKDRIHSWFYRVRKYYTGITPESADLYEQTDFNGDPIEQQIPGKIFGPIQVNGPTLPLKIGKILNPYDVDKIPPVKIDPVLLAAAPAYYANVQKEITKGYTENWNKFVGFPHYNEQKQNTIDFFVLDKFNKSAGGSGEFNLDGTGRYKFFVKFKVFLDFIEEAIIPTILPSNKSTGKVPLLKIDTDTNSNICYAIDNMISSNIKSCIIRNDEFLNIRGQNIGTNKMFEGIDYFIGYSSDGKFKYGRPMNVYLNFEFIQSLLQKLSGKTGETVLFDFLKNICDEINLCLGNVNNLEPVIDHTTNTIKIIDQTPIPGIKEIASSLLNDFENKVYPNFTPSEPTTLEIYGYNPKTNPEDNTSNFIHNIGLNTTISKNYASMITIGATANGSIPGIEATAFSRWNEGIEDRIKPELVDGGVSAYNYASLKSQNELVIERYQSFIRYSSEEDQFKTLGLSKDGSFNEIYEKNNPAIISDFFNYAQAESSKTGSLESSVGFLPFNLKIDMEGISGIKIYNRLNVDTRFLPSNYPETLDFIITKVNHKLSNNKWETSLETQATKIIDDKKDGANINTSELLELPISQKIQAESYTPEFKNGNQPSYFINNDTNGHLQNIPGPKRGKITVDQIVGCLHPQIEERYRKFLNRLVNETTGYGYKVNATFRSFTRSSQFYRKQLNPKYTSSPARSTAYPGSSNHNLGIAIDMTVIDLETGTTYGLKSSREKWEKLPLVKIALEEKMSWGGTYSTGYDPVHFNPSEVDFNKIRSSLYSAFGSNVSKFKGIKNQKQSKNALNFDLTVLKTGGLDTSSYYDESKSGIDGDYNKRWYNPNTLVDIRRIIYSKVNIL